MFKGILRLDGHITVTGLNQIPRLIRLGNVLRHKFCENRATKCLRGKQVEPIWINCRFSKPIRQSKFESIESCGLGS